MPGLHGVRIGVLRHFWEEDLKVADDVVLLNTGRVVFAGTRATFLAQQASLNTHLGVE